MRRWISFHDADILCVVLAPGRVLIHATEVETGLGGAADRKRAGCKAVLECESVSKVVVDGFTDQYEYVLDLEVRLDSESDFKHLQIAGTTPCAEVKLTLWPPTETIRITCTSVTLRLLDSPGPAQ